MSRTPSRPTAAIACQRNGAFTAALLEKQTSTEGPRQSHGIGIPGAEPAPAHLRLDGLAGLSMPASDAFAAEANVERRLPATAAVHERGAATLAVHSRRQVPLAHGDLRW